MSAVSLPVGVPDNSLGLLSTIQLRALRYFYPKSPDLLTESLCESKLHLLGDNLPNKIRGKVVIDFGCGKGSESISMAKLGAKKVIGIDIQEIHLQTAHTRAVSEGVQDICSFATSTTEKADVIISIDAFEHFSDPGEILNIMLRLLKPGGIALISFGPTWYHPLGGHLFSVFPWAHLLFTEKALINWRSGFKSDGATRFTEVAGGLNQITIRKFKRIVEGSGASLTKLELTPIRPLRPIHSTLTREFTTAIVLAEMVK